MPRPSLPLLPSRVVALLLALLLLAGAAPVAGAQATEQWSAPVRTEQVDPDRVQRAERVARPAPLDARIVGVWDVWVSGAVTYSTDGRDVYRRYTPGAAMNRLQVSRDGSYQWGAHRGRLVEVRPWHAQEGRRYWRIVHATGGEYDLYYGDGDRLVLLFGDVGGHASTGTRLAAAGTAPAAPATPAAPAAPVAPVAPGAPTGTAAYRAGDRVQIQWQGGWYAGRVLQVRQGRYEVSYDGYSSSWNEWVGAERLRRP